MTVTHIVTRSKHRWQHLDFAGRPGADCAVVGGQQELHGTVQQGLYLDRYRAEDLLVALRERLLVHVRHLQHAVLVTEVSLRISNRGVCY